MHLSCGPALREVPGSAGPSLQIMQAAWLAHAGTHLSEPGISRLSLHCPPFSSARCSLHPTTVVFQKDAIHFVGLPTGSVHAALFTLRYFPLIPVSFFLQQPELSSSCSTYRSYLYFQGVGLGLYWSLLSPCLPPPAELPVLLTAGGSMRAAWMLL